MLTIFEKQKSNKVVILEFLDCSLHHKICLKMAKFKPLDCLNLQVDSTELDKSNQNGNVGWLIMTGFNKNIKKKWLKDQIR